MALAAISGPLSGLRERVARWDSARVLALLGGLGIGIAVLVRIDAAGRRAADLSPTSGCSLVRRQRQAVPLHHRHGDRLGCGAVFDAIFCPEPYPYIVLQLAAPLGNRSSSIPMI